MFNNDDALQLVDQLLGTPAAAPANIPASPIHAAGPPGLPDLQPALAPMHAPAAAYHRVGNGSLIHRFEHEHDLLAKERHSLHKLHADRERHNQRMERENAEREHEIRILQLEQALQQQRQPQQHKARVRSKPTPRAGCWSCGSQHHHQADCDRKGQNRNVSSRPYHKRRDDYRHSYKGKVRARPSSERRHHSEDEDGYSTGEGYISDRPHRRSPSPTPARASGSGLGTNARRTYGPPTRNNDEPIRHNGDFVNLRNRASASIATRSATGTSQIARSVSPDDLPMGDANEQGNAVNDLADGLANANALGGIGLANEVAAVVHDHAGNETH